MKVGNRDLSPAAPYQDRSSRGVHACNFACNCSRTRNPSVLSRAYPQSRTGKFPSQNCLGRFRLKPVEQPDNIARAEKISQNLMGVSAGEAGLDPSIFCA